jgi:hypothetical protein
MSNLGLRKIHIKRDLSSVQIEVYKIPSEYSFFYNNVPKIYLFN